ncbi:aromatic amino acid hydrolase AAH2 [Besnoitia besnoiti]|uniref:phenylalanine 4-monooxygenase n=1 Tax=Besnoitia besnoiti TaxID=94643 RepID=A0A2A9MHA1_BESBE|nr:aromatic amino acid hydrolase AAH2 [Besnoitia besnoiti]PFH36544.1 aromatic amino acid hydrolase AAH2 [Besnoitia besnoiti]
MAFRTLSRIHFSAALLAVRGGAQSSMSQEQGHQGVYPSRSDLLGQRVLGFAATQFTTCAAGSTWVVSAAKEAQNAGVDQGVEASSRRSSLIRQTHLRLDEEGEAFASASDENESAVATSAFGSSKHGNPLLRRLPINTVSCEIEDRVGALCNLIGIFAAHNLNITQLKSTPNPLDLRKMTFSISFEGDWETEKVKQLVDKLKSICVAFARGAPKDVPWFPRSVEDLDGLASHTLEASKDLEADHPGFHDAVYRKRRQEIAALAQNHRSGQPIGLVDYTPEEVATWNHVWGILTELYPTRACREYNEVLAELRDAGLYGPDRVPQVAEVNEYIKGKTGFTLRPVAGLLAARDFMNALAFRTFFSTQYIRHHSAPLYTPEPDIIHELLGHAPLLANPDFAEFSQLLGLASLGASEEDIVRLQRCYWFSVEFGLLLESTQSHGLTAYGAGLLSSPGELQHATSPTNTRLAIHRWSPEEAARQQFPITTFQPVLYAADSLKDAREILLQYIQNHIHTPFSTRFDSQTGTIQVTTDVRSRPVSLKF